MTNKTYTKEPTNNILIAIGLILLVLFMALADNFSDDPGRNATSNFKNLKTK